MDSICILRSPSFVVFCYQLQYPVIEAMNANHETETSCLITCDGHGPTSLLLLLLINFAIFIIFRK